MFILSTQEILHENPYTGDKITKARIVHIDPSIFPIKTVNVNANSNDNDNDNDNHSIEPLEEQERRNLPDLIAIKYLSDYKVLKPRHVQNPGRSSSWDSSDDEVEEEDEGEIFNSFDEQVTRENPEWPLIGERASKGVRFGIKAGREIRALKAAQGHVNVVPFLGFTTPPIPNPFKSQNDNKGPRAYGGGLLGPEPIIEDKIKTEASLFGEPIGKSLFQEQNLYSHSSVSPPTSSSRGDLLPPFHNSGFNSDYDTDQSYNSDEDDISCHGGVSDGGSSTDAKAWNRIFVRQPRLGGIILPYVPCTMQDLIHVGWTKTRPHLVETCMRQILEGLDWIHNDSNLIHRDISAKNILVTVEDSVLRSKDAEGFKSGFVRCMISDFGCATFCQPTSRDGETQEDSNLSNSNDSQERNVDQIDKGKLTFEVGTRAYRAPELLFSSGEYTSAIDIWSAGVLFGEMFLGKTLFEAESDIGQVCAIVKVLGTPTEENWPEYASMPDYGKLVFQALETNPLSSIFLSEDVGDSGDELTRDKNKPTLITPEAFGLIESMISYSGSSRPTAKEALLFNYQFLRRTKIKELVAEQCTIDEGVIMEEVKKLREREKEEDEYGEYGGYGRSTEDWGYPYGDDGMVSEDEEREHRSDDLAEQGEIDAALGSDYGFEEYDNNTTDQTRRDK